MKNYKITVLKGDGIGPEIVNECIKVLDKAGEKFGFAFDYDYELLGGCAIDEAGVPYPEKQQKLVKLQMLYFSAQWAALSGTVSRATIVLKRDFLQFVRI